MPALVSVIIPCYNAARYIDRSIKSVYEQDWQCIELIVVDDGSIDRSADCIHAWEPKFLLRDGYSLLYIHQENRGLGGAIKTALEYINGQYISLLDADDRYMPTSISEKAKYLDDHPEQSIVRSNGYIVSGERKWLFTYNAREKTGDLFEMLMHGETFNWAGSYMVRADVLLSFYKERAFYPSRFGQNLQIMIPVSYKNKSGFIDKPLMEYIRVENSLTKERDPVRAKEKSVKNAYGYLDIREHIISTMKFEKEEEKKWLKIAKGIYNRRMLEIGIEYNDIQIIKKAKQQLKNLGQYTIEDRILYYSTKNLYVCYILRIFRKLKSVWKE